mgnify:CR=1 FL=1
MTLRWYELLNTQGDTILYNNKPVLFQHTPLQTTRPYTWYSDEEIQGMSGNSSFTNGWLEKKHVYLVDEEGLASKSLMAYVMGS